MNKLEIKNILMSMRTKDNEAHVNFLLGKLDMLNEEQVSEYLQKIGDSENIVKLFLSEKLQSLELNEIRNDTQYKINNLFTYGITKNSIHLHLPESLQDSISKDGIKKTMDIVNLYLLDAIDKIYSMKKSQHPQISNATNIYMISPILLKRELKFLEELDFQTKIYYKDDLSDTNFLLDNPEAQLAKNLFGTDKNVGTASISFDTISTQEWQKEKEDIIKNFNDSGIYIEENLKEEEIR